MTLPSVRILGFSLGTVFLLFGVFEVITHWSNSAGALAFWGVSLLGGGALVIVGTLLLTTRRAWGLILLTIGALVASNATFWTLLLPIAAVVTVLAAYRDHKPGVRAA